MEAGEKILVVDDNKFLRIVVSKMLSRLGYEVSSADSGENGLRIFLKNKFDVDKVISKPFALAEIDETIQNVSGKALRA